MSDQTTGNPFAEIRDDVFSAGDDMVAGSAVLEATEDLGDGAESVDEAADEPEQPTETTEGLPETVAEDSEDEASDVEGEEANDEAVEEETAETRTIPIKFYGEEEAFDPFADEAETARLIQMGKDYDKKSGLNDAIQKGIVRFDLDSGGLVPGEAYDRAKVSGAETVIQALEQRGLVERGVDGQPVIATAVQQFLSRAATDASADPAETKLAELKARWDEENSREAWTAYAEAKTEHEVNRRFRTMEANQRKAAQETTQAQQVQEAFARADQNLEAKANEIKAMFNDPDGQFNEAAWNRELAIAKRLTRSIADGSYQYQAALTGLEEAAKIRAATNKRIVKAVTRKPTQRAKSPATPSGRPASGKPPKTQAVPYDPRDPFGHIPNPLESRG